MVRGNTLYDCNFLKFIEPCFMAQCMICFGEFFTHWFVNSMFCCWVGITFYKDQLGSITCWCCSNFYFYWFLSTSITEKGLLKLITVDLNWYVFPVKSVSFCFVYLETLLLDVYIFRTIMSSPWIDPFIIIKCPFLKKKKNSGSFFEDYFVIYKVT